MGGKGISTVILCVLILGLLLAQNQVEAKKKSCCRSTASRNLYNICRLRFSQEACKNYGCELVDEPPCPSDYPKMFSLLDSDLIEEAEATNINCPTTTALSSFRSCSLHPAVCAKESGCTLTPGDINDYCKLGCASSLCSAHNSDIGEEEGAENCKKACSEFCAKGSNIAMVTAA